MKLSFSLKLNDSPALNFKLNEHFTSASIPWFDCYVGGFGESEKPGLSGNMVAGLWGAENNSNEGNFHIIH